MPKRVLLVSGDFVLTGGMDRANYALADFLLRNDVTVEIVAHRIAPELRQFPNLSFFQVPKPWDSYFFGASQLDRAGRKRAKAVLQAGGRVVVNGGNCLVGDMNWVHYVHAAYAPKNTSMSRRIKQFVERPFLLAGERRALIRAKLIIANSEATKTTIQKAYGIRPEVIKTVYYGTDSARFRPATSAEKKSMRARFGWDDAPRIVFIGALGDRRKGFDIIAEAWSQLVARGRWDAKLVVIGAGVEKARWERQIADSGFGQSVTFLGFRDDVDAILQAADCLVAPTRYEAYGLGVHEAICCGLPVLVSSDAGISERFPDNLAWMRIPVPSSAETLAAKLHEWSRVAGKYDLEISSFSDSMRERSWDHMSHEFMGSIA